MLTPLSHLQVSYTTPCKQNETFDIVIMNFEKH